MSRGCSEQPSGKGSARSAILCEVMESRPWFRSFADEPSGAELLRQSQEPDRGGRSSEVKELIGEGVAIVDVRETEEFATGHLPGAKHVPRSYLETRIEGVVPDRAPAASSSTAPPATAPPTRRARCRRTSATSTSRSMTGGITLWKDRGYEVVVPRTLTAEQRDRYSRHLLIPEIGAEGQQKLLDAKVLLLGAGGLGSPTALYLAAAGVGTLGIVDDDEVDLSNLQRQVIHTTERIGVPKVDSAEESIHALNPDVKVVKYQTAHRRLEHHGDHRGLGRGRRRRRQLPHPLPAQRRHRAPADPGGVGLDPRLRRPAVGVQALRRARATAACSASRRRPSWRRRAAPTACSACCPGRWGCSRRPRSSS